MRIPTSLFLVAMTAVVQACATSGTQPEFEETKVLETMDGSSKPEWTSKQASMSDDGRDVAFVSSVSMSGDARTEPCVKSAELSAKSDFLRHIKENITTSGQLDDTSVTSDPSYESFTAFLSSGSINGAKSTGRFWEKLVESDTNGNRVLKLRCYAKISVSKTELARQLREATNKQGGNAEVRKALIESQTKFIESLSSSESK